MTADVVPILAITAPHRHYDRFAHLRRMAAQAWADWINGPEVPSVCDIQTELFASFTVLAQVAELARPAKAAPEAAPDWPQGEDWGDACDAPAGGHHA